MSSTFRRHWGSWEDVRKRLRQTIIPRRVLIIALCSFVVLYVFYSLFFSSSNSPSMIHTCSADRVRKWKRLEEDYLVSVSSELPSFAGNGFIGVGGDGELRIVNPRQQVLSQKTSFFPLISANVVKAFSEARETVIDYRSGVVKTIQCFALGEDCVCVTSSFYAHRTRPHVFVQDIETMNPTNEPVKVQLTSEEQSTWTRGESVDKTFVYSHVVNINGVPNALGAVCSYVPKEIIVERKREESERFFCIFNYEPIKSNELMEGRKPVSKAVAKEFADILGVGSAALDLEHEKAWQNLNSVSFGISKSLAPEVLNPEIINASRYLLLSNIRAPLLENSVSPDRRQKAHTLMYQREDNGCYSGHSTLFVPSTALWKLSGSVDNVIEAVSVWILTLEKNGCANFVKAGATGVAQAFLLTLLAAKFTSSHLEVKMEPADLHRELVAQGITLSDKAKLSIAVRLDPENRPYFVVSSSSPIYACGGGCLNIPEIVGTERHIIPIKVTKPLTPILYLSENKQHLEQLHSSIHVSEVVNAPAHEQELIALHKHGHRLGGLPIIFWVLLGALVVIFHLFLFKLLYSEWRKADYTPYNYYLRQRYVRNH